MSEFLAQDLLTEDTPSQSFSNKDAPIQLQVGQCRFTTWRETLTNDSTFFAAMFSGRWDNRTLGDGVVFVDADGSAFNDVLAYLRTGNFPLFFDPASKSFDYARYQVLLGGAKFFSILRLEKWIEMQQYREAVEVQHRQQTFASEEEFNRGISGVDAGDIVNLSSGWGTKKVYICPRFIPVHRGKPGSCGRDCEKARAGAAWMFEDEPTFEGMITTTRYILKPKVCLGENFTHDLS